VLGVTGAIGFAVGVLVEPTWQDVIEPAQVLAGLVPYPSDNPVFIYSTSTWTLLHQIPALLLRAGLSERALAVLLSGLSGLISFQALGIVILALSEDAALAALMPLFIYVADATTGGVAYPVVLVGSIYTSGAIGLSLALLVLGLFGAGAYRPAALLLAIIPAVHVTLGVSCAGIVAIAAAASGPEVRQQLWRARYWLAAGLSITAVSGLAHFGSFPARWLPPAERLVYLQAVMTYWDQHRRPFARLSIDAAPFFIGMIAAAVSRNVFRDHVSGSARFMLLLLVVAGGVGMIASAVLALEPALLDYWLWRAMPSRLMNLPLLACMPIIVGLAGRLRHDARSDAILAGMVLVVIVIVAAARPIAARASYYVMLAAVIALFATVGRRSAPGGVPVQTGRGSRRSALRIAVLAVPIALAAMLAWGAPNSFSTGVVALADRATDAFYARVAERPGVLLTASDLHLIQLRTRRPVLLDGGALDGLAYVPAAAPMTKLVLERIYGVDLLAPGFDPREARGTLPHDAGRVVWESRAPAEWRALGDAFGVTDVLAFADWRLQLPEVARSQELVLYSLGP
jgi:hypothetical protein